MDPSDHYADPFGKAFSYSSQRAAQLIHRQRAVQPPRVGGGQSDRGCGDPDLRGR